MVFDLDDKKVRAITSSFLDSIIIELLFPESKFPEAVLYQLLQDVLQESPKRISRAANEPQITSRTGSDEVTLTFVVDDDEDWTGSS